MWKFPVPSDKFQTISLEFLEATDSPLNDLKKWGDSAKKKGLMETERPIPEGRSPRQEVSRVFDLVVCGGGLAGVCAALAASRLGLKTALVQDRSVLGGNSSSEIRVPLGGAANGNPWAREGGIIEELVLTERFNNFTSRRESQINDVWDLVLYDTCRQEENLSLYLDASVRRVKKEGNRLISVSASQLGSERELEIRGNLFVDATGDGVIAYLSGAEYRMGREGRDEFDERWAPDKPDMGIMGSSTLFAVKDVGKPVPFRPPSWAEKYPADSITLKTRFHERLPGHWWIEVGFPYHTIFDNEKIRDELMRHVLGVWDHLKNQEDHGFANYALDWIGTGRRNMCLALQGTEHPAQGCISRVNKEVAATTPQR
jgi:hypothetical protein